MELGLQSSSGPGRAQESTSMTACAVIFGVRAELVPIAPGGDTFWAVSGTPVSASSHTGGRTASTHMTIGGTSHGAMPTSVTKCVLLEPTFKPAPQLFGCGRTCANAGRSKVLRFRRGRIDLLRQPDSGTDAQGGRDYPGHNFQPVGENRAHHP